MNILSINTQFAQKLVHSQFPQYSNYEIRSVQNQGIDNRTFRLGEKLSIRIPSAPQYAEQVLKEYYLLPVMRKQLPILIPESVKLGKASNRLPWQWAIYKWIDGRDASVHPSKDLTNIACNLSAFLNNMYTIETVDVPLAGKHNFYRGGNLKVYELETLTAISHLDGVIDGNVLHKIWNLAMSSTWTKDPVIVHGDISSSNLLLNASGELISVIDFGLAAKGDPACDLAITWTLFKGKSRALFRRELKIDSETWNRARGWLVWKMLITALDNDRRVQEQQKALKIIRDISHEFVEGRV